MGGGITLKFTIDSPHSSNLSKPGVEPGADLPAQGLQRALEYMWDTINALLWDKSKQRVGLPLAAACYVFDWYS